MRSRLFGVVSKIGLVGLVLVSSVGIAACTNDDSSSDPVAGTPGPAGPEGPEGKPGAPAASTATSSGSPTTPTTTEAPKAVYTLSNDATSNAVFVYTRAADGSLTPSDVYATGGKGTGSGLGDQGALVFDAAKKLFFAVNAGDDSISMMSLKDDGSLRLISKVASGGMRPISVTVFGNVVYAVNAGTAASAANITGFRVGAGGLTKIESSTQMLSAFNPVPAQIQFSPDGKLLVVTEKATNMIDTYSVNADGVASSVNAQVSAGKTPFGFAFSTNGKQVIVSEAFGGDDGKGATSSYSLTGEQGKLTTLSPSVFSAQSAPCWVAVAGNHAYVTNTKSNSVTAYTINEATGMITLLDPSGVTAKTGQTPIDVDATDGNDLLYTLNAKDHSFSIYTIRADGGLTAKSDFAGLPESAVGLVAR